MDDGFFGSAIWFLVGFFVVPWVLRFAMGYVAPVVGLGGSMMIYVIIGIQAVAGLVAFKWHGAFAIGIGLATLKDIVSMFYPLPF